ncbi:MAG: sodium:solute symporter, partial [Saprospiraceae bacterium]
MQPGLILSLLLVYFIILYIVSWLTSRNVSNSSFFTAGRRSPWYLIAYSMIGTSISGVTFISIPGVVGSGGMNQAFSYMQFVLGYLVGYLVIAFVLMPIYYKLNLTTIYGYLEKRLGWHAYKTGAGFFILSRSVGCAFRLYLAAMVFQEFLIKDFGVPFWVTVSTTIGLVWLFTFKGGLKTVIWTDAIQTTMFMLAVILTIHFIGTEMHLSLSGVVQTIEESKYSKVFFWDDFWTEPNHFFKQFISGMLITIVMTGLDQDMMQKNLSCRNLRDAQKNMISFSLILIIVNLLFLSMGALLYLYAEQSGIPIPTRTDQLYPIIAFHHLPAFAAIVFIMGLASATYSSSDSALTSLTTSFCVDFLNFEKSDKGSEKVK